MKKFEQWELDFIKENYLKMTDGEIAKKLKSTIPTISNKRRRMGLKKDSTYERIDELIDDYKNGIKLIELEKKYNSTTSNIINLLQSRGIYKYVNNHWNQEEIELLKNVYSSYEWDDILELFPNRDKQNIIDKASKLKLVKENYYWNDEDIQILTLEYENNTSIKDIVLILNNKFTYSAIISKAEKLGLCKNKHWTENELNVLYKYYPIKTPDEMMELLPNRKRKNIVSKACRLGIKNIIFKNLWFSDSDIDFIKLNYNCMTDVEIGLHLNRSFHAICDKRLQLGLLKEYEKSSYEDLSEYLRRNNLEWKNDSMINCKYKCVITNKRFDDIHHLYGLNLILNETLETLNIPIKETMDDYVSDELRKILDKYRELQKQYPLGICLTQEVHKLFHSIYGFGDNTPEQFEEFKQRYDRGEFSELLSA